MFSRGAQHLFAVVSSGNLILLIIYNPSRLYTGAAASCKPLWESAGLVQRRLSNNCVNRDQLPHTVSPLDCADALLSGSSGRARLLKLPQVVKATHCSSRVWQVRVKASVACAAADDTGDRFEVKGRKLKSGWCHSLKQTVAQKVKQDLRWVVKGIHEMLPDFTHNLIISFFARLTMQRF